MYKRWEKMCERWVFMDEPGKKPEVGEVKRANLATEANEAK